jgi:hypothetical protein
MALSKTSLLHWINLSFSRMNQKGPMGFFGITIR